MTFSLVCSFSHTTHRMIKVVEKAPTPNSALAVSCKHVIASTTLAATNDPLQAIKNLMQLARHVGHLTTPYTTPWLECNVFQQK